MSLILYLMNGKWTEVRTDTHHCQYTEKDLNFAFMGIFHKNQSKKSDINVIFN